jgi:hypothetical protein
MLRKPGLAALRAMLYALWDHVLGAELLKVLEALGAAVLVGVT